MYMEDKKEENIIGKKESVHFLLAHAYIFFFACVILGVLFESILKIDLFKSKIFSYIGIFLILLGTLIVYWAQKSSAKASKISMEDSSTAGFAFGPYKFIKHPTYLGLFVTSLGFSFLIESLASIIFVVIAYVILKITFVKKEEKMLAKKYGEKYLNYKSKGK